MTTYGQEKAARTLDQHARVALAALDGNREALIALVTFVAESARADGMRVAMEPVPVDEVCS